MGWAVQKRMLAQPGPAEQAGGQRASVQALREVQWWQRTLTQRFHLRAYAEAPTASPSPQLPQGAGKCTSQEKQEDGMPVIDSGL